MFNVDEFSAGLKRWQKANQLSNNEAAIALALNLAENVIRATPVDTGWARANWYPSINSKPNPPNTGKRNPNQEAETTMGMARKQRKEAVAKNSASGAQASIDRAGQEFAKGKAGDIFTLSNGVPYIMRLETGWSKQAPKGMVANSIVLTRNFLQNFKAPDTP